MKYYSIKGVNLMPDANLLVTFDPNHSGKAKEIVEAVLKEAGEAADFLESKIDGLFLLKVSDAKVAVKKLVDLCKKDKSKFKGTFKFVPIEKWTSSKIEDIQAAIKELQEGIGAEEKWKMDLGKRQTEHHEKDLIIKLTDPIDRPNVDLKDPAKIMKVEIVGKDTGVSLLTPDELLDTQKI
jgi:tRNA(Ser,Leu) C12 N-acetylase TAN1